MLSSNISAFAFGAPYALALSEMIFFCPLYLSHETLTVVPGL